MENSLDLGQKIKEIREKKNLSQERFGKKIGKSGKTISAYEKGRCTPTLKVLDSISQVYDATFLHLKESRKNQLWEKLKSMKTVMEELEATLLSDSKDL
jgi:transcriptional regulator with XRE-family HTH domain